MIYEREEKAKEGTNVMAIDLGLDNLATCTNMNNKETLIIAGEIAKSKIGYYNKEIGRLQRIQMKMLGNKKYKNTKQIENLIRQRETNIAQASELKELLAMVENKEDGWKDKVKEANSKFSDDIIESLSIIGRNRTKTSQNYEDSLKLINARISNLETNLHIEIDMERIEDRSKALSYIGIEVADALKGIPAPLDEIEETTKTDQNVTVEEQQYIDETRFEVKPSLWQRIKNSKIAKAICYVLKIKITLQLPDALPEGRGEQH